MNHDELQRVIAEHRLWRNGAGGQRADLRMANLRWANLRWADLSWADLSWANLHGANLSGADLSWANLHGASLSWANLHGANLSGADLSWANLRRADLSEAILDTFYKDVPVTLDEVRHVILSHPNRLSMNVWHSEESWHNGTAHPVDECGTAHCIAGWAHHLAALKRPELLDPKVNVELLGRLALGDEAASHFYDDSNEVMKWLESLEVPE